ncbi:MAG TPA: hypothetical protein VFR15_06530 [Chloroflexia bacterium]|nr:hypothetical protein [Chloroflexia bacterium]
MPHAAHPNRPPDIPALLDALDRHGVRYVLVGSVAAQVYGVDTGRPGDFDITPALDPGNLRRLADLLVEIEAGLDPDEPFGHWEVQADGERKWAADEATPERVAERANWRPDPEDPDTFDHLFRSRLGNFDVVPDLSGTYDTLVKRAVPMTAHGHDILVVHIDELLAALTLPRRPKDVPRVRQLREIQRRRGEEERSRAGE